MKANRNFKQADEAVSPVIGVILMVAITVVLAAVVFVLVNDLGSSGDSAPVMGISQDEGTDRLNIDKAPSTSVPWTDITITAQGNTTALRVDLNGAANGTDEFFGGAWESGNIAGGDYLEFCADTSANSEVTIVLTHTPSGQVIKRTTFNSLGACA